MTHADTFSGLHCMRARRPITALTRQEASCVIPFRGCCSVQPASRLKPEICARSLADCCQHITRAGFRAVVIEEVGELSASRTDTDCMMSDMQYRMSDTT